MYVCVASKGTTHFYDAIGIYAYKLKLIKSNSKLTFEMIM